MIVLIPYINLLNLFGVIKCLFLKNMEPLIQAHKGLHEADGHVRISYLIGSLASFSILRPVMRTETYANSQQKTK